MTLWCLLTSIKRVNDRIWDNVGMLVNQSEDLQTLIIVGQLYRKAFGHTPEYRCINVIWSIGGPEDQYPVRGGEKAVP